MLDVVVFVEILLVAVRTKNDPSKATRDQGGNESAPKKEQCGEGQEHDADKRTGVTPDRPEDEEPGEPHDEGWNEEEDEEKHGRTFRFRTTP